MKEYTNYTKLYVEFDKILRKVIKLSRDCAGIPSPTRIQFYASALFTKLCTTAVSLRKLAPSPRLLGENAYWDYASACSLTRNLIECYLVFYYLCVQKVEEAEWDARVRLFNVHDCLSRKKMFTLVGIEPEKEAAQVIEITLNQLKNNSYFRSLSPKKQQHYLKGNNAFFMSKNEIVKSFGGDINEFRFTYQFLSNQIHSLPMSFYRMAEQVRGTGVESNVEIDHTASCLEMACPYLKRAYNEYKIIFQKVEGEK